MEKLFVGTLVDSPDEVPANEHVTSSQTPTTNHVRVEMLPDDSNHQLLTPSNL